MYKIGDLVTFRKDGTKCRVASVTRGAWTGQWVLVIEHVDDKTKAIVCGSEDVDASN